MNLSSLNLVIYSLCKDAGSNTRIATLFSFIQAEERKSLQPSRYATCSGRAQLTSKKTLASLPCTPQLTFLLPVGAGFGGEDWAACQEQTLSSPFDRMCDIFRDKSKTSTAVFIAFDLGLSSWVNSIGLLRSIP